MVHDAHLELDQPAADRLSAEPGARAAGPHLATVLTAVLALVVVAAAVAWHATGGSFHIVRTASMGTAAPVGSLVLDRPIDRPLSAGEVISFHPPGSDEVFTHRIVAIGPGGVIHTQGDINAAPDGWTLTRSEVLGRTVATIPYLGWVVRAMPILAIGILLVWLCTIRWVQRAWRTTARAAGLAIVVVVAITVYRPLFGASIIVFGHGHGPRGGAAGAVVSTGIVPARVTAVGGSAQTIGDGQVARVFTRRPSAPHHYELTVEPAYELTWILPLLLLLAIPPALSLAVDDGRASGDPGEDAVGDGERDGGPLAQRLLQDELGRGVGAAAAWPEPVERQRN